jgi:hypothetical protein
MAELAEAQRHSLEKAFGREMIFYVPKPRELERLSDYEIRAIADKQLPPPPKRRDFLAEFEALRDPYDPTRIVPQ